MESFLSSRSLGEESLQMWDLNKRLEAYLARVKFLEEENELLKAEIQGLKGGSAENSWRAKYEEEVVALRATLDQAYQEKCMVELARDSLYEEVQQVKSRCQKERAAHEEAKMFLSISKKEMEEEKRTHIWLREKATQLEKEIEALVEAHQEELLGLDQEMASFSQTFDSFRAGPVCFQPVEVEDYAKRLSNIWKGAVETYKMEVSQLEASLCEAKENLWKATERNRQNQLQLQQLEKELASLKVRKKSLEDSLSQQWAQQQGDAEKLQMAMEALEEEKQSLRGQISHVLEDRQQLMHLKMSLSLEVATYRTLLEAESTRLQMPGAEFQLARGLRDVTAEATQGKLQGLPTDRGRSGSRDVRPSPVAFPKGAPKLRGFQSKAESVSASLGPLGAKNHSSAAREFQKANTALRHSQPTESIERPLPPKEASAFSLDSSQQSQKVTHIESVAQSVFHTHTPLPFNSVELEEVSGRSAESLEQQEEGEKGALAQREAEGTGGNEEEAFGEKEMEDDEERWLSTEPLGKREVLNGPFPSQMVTEALETAIQEVNRKEAHLEPSLLNAVKSQADDSLGHPSSLEEENKDAVPLSTEVLEMAQEDRMGEGQPTNLLEDLQACEDFAEVNGGQEAWAELQGTEEAWPALGAEAPLPLGAELPRAERIVEDVAVLVTGKKETYEETGSPEWKESDTDEELPTLLGMALGNDLGEAPKHPESATEAPRNDSSNQEGWERGSLQPDVLGGASEVNMEEVYGEAEDVEMVSTEDLPEETREPWSPPRENNQSDLQAELLGREQLQLEGNSAREDWSPTIHTALSAGEHQKPLFLKDEQEKFESQEEPLHETDSALPEQENEEKGLDSEVFCVEDALPRSSAIDEDGTLADEPKAIKSREITEEDEKKAREEVFKSESLLRDDMGDEGTVERESYLDLEAPKSTLELGVILPGEDVASLQVQETHQEEQRTEVPEEQPLEEQKEGGGGLSESLLQAEGSELKERDLMTASEAPESEEVTDALEVEEVTGTIMRENLLQRKENALECSEDKEFGLNNHQAGEQPSVAEGPWTEQTTCPEEDQELGSPPEAKGPAADLIFQREDSRPEEILEHLESSPNSNNERDGTEEEHVILLEETLPDHTALHVYHGQVLAMTETSSVPFLEREEMPLLAQEDEPPISEEDSASILLAKENGMEGGAPKEERGCSPQALPEEDRPCSEEPLAAEGLAEAVIQTSPFMGEKDDQGMVEAEVTREEEHEELEVVPGRDPEEDPWQEGDVEKGSEVPKEEVDSELALELEEHCVFQADGFDPSYTQQEEEEEEEEEGPLEISDQDPTDVAPTKVSPLTSVADLGEIVLEGEGSLSGPKGAVESDVLVSCEDECFHVSDPEDLIQQKIMAVEDPSGTGFPKTFPEDVVGLSLESRRDHDILEIVEQALEFNQELIKAAGDELGALGKDAQHSPEDRSLHVPPSSLDQGQPQVSTEALKSSSPMTSSPKQIHPLVESNANGLQEEPSLEEFTSELLNGIGQDKTDSSGDGFIKEVTITPQFCTEGLDNFPMAETVSQSPPPMPASEKGFRSGEVSPEVLEKVSLDQEGLETLDENILDDLRQKTCVKGGKDTELEAMPFLFGDEIHRQPLEFRPEGDMDLQSSEDN
ncbi:nestin [Python bivittatus]|uniref:Nestin n=1 Tax=Python bivittatus TaxID=176946 RepID=A0A9F2R6X5_PYTBI|nr:nestin [Python bivittatus]